MAKLGNATVFIGADLGGLNAALGKAQSNVKRSMGNIQASMKQVGAGMMAVGGGVLAAMGGAVKSFTDTGSALLELNQKTGISVEELSRLKVAAELSGTSLDGLEVAIKKMQKSIYDAGMESKRTGETMDKKLATAADRLAKAQTKAAEAAAKHGRSSVEYRKALAGVAEQQAKYNEALKGGDESTKNYAAALQKLGIDLETLKKQSPEQQFNTLTTAVAGVKDATEKAALAQIFFGKQGTQLLPMLAGGSDAFAKLKQEAEAMGLVMSEKAAIDAEALGDEIDKVKMNVQGAAWQIAIALVPMIRELIPEIVKTVQAIRDWVKENPELIKDIAKVAAALVGGGGLLIAMSSVAGAIGTLVSLVGGAAVAGSLAFVLVGLSAILEGFATPGFHNWIERTVDKVEFLKETVDGLSNAIVTLLQKMDVLDKNAQFNWRGALNAAGTAATTLLSRGTVTTFPKFAAGTLSAPRGLAMVGERGPELVRMRGGEQVIPNHALGGGAVTVNLQVNNRNVTEADAARIGKMIKSRQRRLALA